MFDLGMHSLQAHSRAELVSLLLVMVTWIAAIAMLGLDTIVVAAIVTYTMPVAVELGRRAWRWIRARLFLPRCPRRMN